MFCYRKTKLIEISLLRSRNFLEKEEEIKKEIYFAIAKWN